MAKNHALDIMIEHQRNLLLRFVQGTPQRHAVNNNLSALVRDWRKTNTLKAAK